MECRCSVGRVGLQWPCFQHTRKTNLGENDVHSRGVSGDERGDLGAVQVFVVQRSTHISR